MDQKRKKSQYIFTCFVILQDPRLTELNDCQDVCREQRPGHPLGHAPAATASKTANHASAAAAKNGFGPATTATATAASNNPVPAAASTCAYTPSAAAATGSVTTSAAAAEGHHPAGGPTDPAAHSGHR